jgi:polyisoprenoid-binding protein YceI
MTTRRLAAALFTVALLGAGSAGSLLADTYKVDPVHSMVVFQIGHLQVSNILGRFNDPTGAIEFDPANLEKASFNVQVEAAKIDTGNAQRDTDLKSRNFFDSQQFPTISFKSTSVKKTGESTYELTGDLTLHGVTKPVTVTLVNTGAGKGMRGELRQGFGTSFTIRRSDFGMTNMIPAAGDEVKLTINLESIKQ